MKKTVKIIPCLDMQGGRVVKGIKFVNLRDAGDPVSCASAYRDQGADELVFLDISATSSGRKPMLEMFSEVAGAVDIPVTLGGGVGSLSDIEAALDAGAAKVSLGSAALRHPPFIEEAAKEFGREKITVAIDADSTQKLPGGYEVYIEGGRVPTGIDAFEFAKQAEDRGAGMLLPTSKKNDGTKDGYDIALTKGITDRVGIPVIASGGAGELEHFLEAAEKGGAEGLLAASVFHFGRVSIPELKNYLRENGIEVSVGS